MGLDHSLGIHLAYSRIDGGDLLSLPVGRKRILLVWSSCTKTRVVPCPQLYLRLVQPLGKHSLRLKLRIRIKSGYLSNSRICDRWAQTNASLGASCDRITGFKLVGNKEHDETR